MKKAKIHQPITGRPSHGNLIYNLLKWNEGITGTRHLKKYNVDQATWLK